MHTNDPRLKFLNRIKSKLQEKFENKQYFLTKQV